MLTRRQAVIGGSAALFSLVIQRDFVAARAGLTTRYGFNDDKIHWRLFDQGAAEAAKTGKPIFFLVHATWCHHCLAYRRLFFDTDVVKRLQKFTPVLVDADAQPELNERYAPTGPYVPRTMFLDAKARLQPKLHRPYDEFHYFVDYLDGPGDLIRLLDQAEKHFSTA